MNTTDGALATDLEDDVRSAEKSIILTSSRQEARAVETSLRKIVVAMPFGKTALEKRKAILNFRRLKYIIEHKCQVIPSPTTGLRVAYDVDVARTIINEIPERALSEIYKADILIALLSERNFTVSYELGYRRGRERTPVMLMVDSEDDVPVYEAAEAYLVWKQGDVVEEIARIANNDFPALVDFRGDIPPSLKEVIDARDDGLTNSLQLALQEIENEFVVYEPDPVQKLRGILSESIDRFYPFSVVEVAFSKDGEFADPNAPARVVDFDEDFCRLYGYPGRRAAMGDRPLTLDRLLKRMEEYSDGDDWNAFLQDQNELTENVVKKGNFARATVPLKINNSHPDDGFKGKSYLPCMAAVVVDGDQAGPHRMYLLVAYIKLDDGMVNCRVSGGEG
jgi:hypothetical protein